jgi:FkbM family methyltransferase
LSSVAKSNVEDAYRDGQGVEAQRLRRAAQTAWGIIPGNKARAKAYIRVAHDSQAKLRRSAYTLGTADIGFEGIKVTADPSDENSCRIYIDGFDESVSVFGIYKRVLPSAGVAIDVGANIGIHSLVMSKCVGAHGRVYSYEPSPPIASKCEANLALNQVQNVVVRHTGVGECPCMMRFSDRSGEFNIGLSCFGPEGTEDIYVSSLDADCRDEPKVDLIKIDVEGMELDVLRGARALLDRCNPALVLEWNDWTLEDLASIVPYRFRASIIPQNPNQCAVPIESEGQKQKGSNVLIVPE